MAKQVWQMTDQEIQDLVRCKYCRAAKGEACVPVRRERNLRGPHVTRGWDARDLLRESEREAA